MRLTGYSDRWSVRPEEPITFHVHCTDPEFRAELVRLRHGDESPLGPGPKATAVPSPADGTYPGQRQVIRKGSYGTAPLDGLLNGADSVGLTVWACPTLPGPEDQGLISIVDRDGPVLALVLTPSGHVRCRAGAAHLDCPVPLAPNEWYRIDAELSGEGVTLEVTAARWQPDFDQPPSRSVSAPPPAPGAEATLVLAAAGIAEGAASGLFNGKLARPALHKDGARLVTWDLGRDPQLSSVPADGASADLALVNRPARAMTGPDWPGGSTSTAPDPATHDAIHFHDDDVADVGWPESFRLTVPGDLPSGVYAFRTRAGGATDHLPFFVCPPRGKAGARLALLMPTMSYLAYANESLDVSEGIQTSPHQDMTLNAEAYAYVAENGLKSLYDLHRDGSGIIHGTRRRPIIDFRPDARCRTFDAPHQFAADLYLVDWLTEKGYAFDVITDDLLHAEGADLLAPYRTVISGTHPEYWTDPMLTARDTWLDAGGRFMYLGGNGFYWVTGVAPDAPDVIEVRRYVGTRTSSGAVGEETLSTTGERGGLWRERGRAPHVRMGIGFSGQGFDRGAPYRRSDQSRDPRWSWVFEGVSDDIVGAGRALVLGHGAAGFEVDKASVQWGTPPHTVVLASTERFTDAYQGAIEMRNQLDLWGGGSDPRSGVQADIAFTPGPADGAVFSVGSITWASTLSARNYDGDTSRITANVLDAFLSDGSPWRGKPGA